MMCNPKASDHAMIERPRPPSQEPRTEPEIIPPGRPDGRSTRILHASINVDGTRRIYIGRLGPFGIFILGLVIAVLTAAILILLLSAVLIWIPIVALLVAGTIISGPLRRYFVASKK